MWNMFIIVIIWDNWMWNMCIIVIDLKIENLFIYYFIEFKQSLKNITIRALYIYVICQKKIKKMEYIRFDLNVMTGHNIYPGQGVCIYM